MSKAQGMSFFEVLFSLFILSYCLLGLTRLYSTSISQMDKNFFVNCAISQINSFTHRMFSNPTHINEEIQEWNQENAIMMPQGFGTVIGNNPYTITVSWYDKISAARVSLSRLIRL
jgi:hypothetical protein